MTSQPPQQTQPAPDIDLEFKGSERRRQIVEIAAQLFAQKGYRGTSMRDIGEQAGMLGGSLYHHIKSKDVLFIELHNAALDAAQRQIEADIAPHSNPWDRLEAACVRLAQIQLGPDSLTLPMMNDFREVPQPTRLKLIARRDAFEALFRTLIEALPLPESIDRSIYRNALLSQLNLASNWYRPGRLSPAEIGRQIARIFRHG
ncbi:TetR/AcrR family transcriptional regulator [Novosphingobium rosa]|uniref:TetR/AcrR family transcriptional regulator n=1 Tax=Novosphingobium rosa TaxID=76978 RepID=UPI00082BEB44|nr:TetR/AcrR family transcriptional regulator [Novosphingobium rosa]